MDHKIIVVDDFLQTHDIDALIGVVRQCRVSQKIFTNHKSRLLASSIFSKYKDAFNAISVIGLHPSVTITNNNTCIRRHLDKKIGRETHKILIYLNDVPDGGTIFYIGDKERIVENRKGRLVLFDISLEHSGQEFDGRNYRKMAIGFRPLMHS
jgi:hypothetical protein